MVTSLVRMVSIDWILPASGPVVGIDFFLDPGVGVAPEVDQVGAIGGASLVAKFVAAGFEALAGGLEPDGVAGGLGQFEGELERRPSASVLATAGASAPWASSAAGLSVAAGGLGFDSSGRSVRRRRSASHWSGRWGSPWRMRTLR